MMLGITGLLPGLWLRLTWVRLSRGGHITIMNVDIHPTVYGGPGEHAGHLHRHMTHMALEGHLSRTWGQYHRARKLNWSLDGGFDIGCRFFIGNVLIWSTGCS